MATTQSTLQPLSNYDTFSTGGTFGGSINDSQLYLPQSGSGSPHNVVLFKNGQIFEFPQDWIRNYASQNGLDYFSAVKKLGTEVSQRLGIPIHSVQDSVIQDLASQQVNQGVSTYVPINSIDELVQVAQRSPAAPPLDPNNAFVQRANGTLPAQQFSNGQYTGSVPTQTQDATSGGLQLQFYKPDPNNPTVYVTDGQTTRPVSLAEFKALTGQNNVPDNQVNFSNVVSGSPKGTVSGGPNAVGTRPDTGTSGGSTGGNVTLPDGTQLTGVYGDLYNQLKAYLDKLQKNGQVINPNVQITPEKLNEFYTQASNEISPYYANQLKVAKDQFLNSLGYSAETISNQEKQAAITYGRNLDTLASNAAESGFAQSGRRVLDEQKLAQDTQNELDQNRRQLAYNTSNAAGQFAQRYGSNNLPSLSIASTPKVTAGQRNFDFSPSSQGIYQLSPEVYAGLTGSEEYQKTADIRNRANQLEEAFRTELANNQQRQLTI